VFATFGKESLKLFFGKDENKKRKKCSEFLIIFKQIIKNPLKTKRLTKCKYNKKRILSIIDGN
jgi:hypothetical protein